MEVFDRFSHRLILTYIKQTPAICGGLFIDELRLFFCLLVHHLVILVIAANSGFDIG